MSDNKKTGKASERVKQFATLVYEESAPENWRDIIDGLCIPCLVSPLHDKDLKEDGSGEFKKPHYHVMFLFDGLKSPQQCREISDSFGGVGLEKIHSIPAYARYLCHLDSPKKAQYDPAEVITFGGADYTQYLNAVKTDRNSAIRGLIKFCDENAIESYAELLKYCAANNEEWFDCLCSTNGTIVIREYLKSVTWTRRTLETPSIDSKVEGMTDYHAGNFRAMQQERREQEQRGLARLPDRTDCPFEQTSIE